MMLVGEKTWERESADLINGKCLSGVVPRFVGQMGVLVFDRRRVESKS